MTSSQYIVIMTQVEGNCQHFFYFILPLYINHLAAAISLLKGDTLLYTLDQQLSSIIFVLCHFFFTATATTHGGKCLTLVPCCGMISVYRVWERQRCLIFWSGSGAHSCSLADLDYHYFPLFSLHSSSTELSHIFSNDKPQYKPYYYGYGATKHILTSCHCLTPS